MSATSARPVGNRRPGPFRAHGVVIAAAEMDAMVDRFAPDAPEHDRAEIGATLAAAVAKVRARALGRLPH
ncbi:hypothetical protein [Thiohalocapsa marina]|uniref:hypothetical protein n=1 Tax=Thiohalocapsa marina TaxID=424902 RepID=UPI0036DA6E8D